MSYIFLKNGEGAFIHRHGFLIFPLEDEENPHKECDQDVNAVEQILYGKTQLLSDVAM